MADKTAVLYLSIKINNGWTFRKTPGTRLRQLTEGAYYVSWYQGASKQMEKSGQEPDGAIVALKRKQAELRFTAAGGKVEHSDEAGSPRVTITEAKKEYLEE
jgi:ribosomal protein L29